MAEHPIQGLMGVTIEKIRDMVNAETIIGDPIHVDAVINYDVPEENEHYTHRIGRTGRARKQGASYLFYTKEEQKRVDQLLRLTRNTDDCKSVKFDFNHEHLKIEDTAPADKFQIKAYF